jgi:hypothetical protein
LLAKLKSTGDFGLRASFKPAVRSFFVHNSRSRTDADYKPPRIIRKVGWHHCIKGRRPYFSEDVVRLRMCDPARRTTTASHEIG